MTIAAAPTPMSRRMTCARCGTSFDCGLSGDCWCASEPVRLPLPGDADEDCVCAACLRTMVETRKEGTANR